MTEQKLSCGHHESHWISHRRGCMSCNPLPTAKPTPATYAITGASGSLGTALTHHLLSEGHKVRGISRNEHRMTALLQSIPPHLQDSFSPLCGDVRNRLRLARAFSRCDYVIHAAAMKDVTRCEYDPQEAIDTNINGTQNVADACIDVGVKRAVFISSDKACSPHNLYGMTKATGERLWLASNRYSAGVGTEFVAVRYGNVWGSNGSVIRKWTALRSSGQASERLHITDPECTRFHLRLDGAVSLVLSALRDAPLGSLCVPVLPSYRLKDLAEAFQNGSQVETQVIGLRPGEKLHEMMVNEHEAHHAVMESGRIRIDPAIDGSGVREYTSGANEWRLSVEELRGEIAWLKGAGA